MFGSLISLPIVLNPSLKKEASHLSIISLILVMVQTLTSSQLSECPLQTYKMHLKHANLLCFPQQHQIALHLLCQQRNRFFTLHCFMNYCLKVFQVKYLLNKQLHINFAQQEQHTSYWQQLDVKGNLSVRLQKFLQCRHFRLSRSISILIILISQLNCEGKGMDPQMLVAV
ncbi:hypothetical protein FGO68_gene12781 [Halteria grandinella]|uniref:Uncharacterized protein n=1 Tax=Halteria grandinella TaxID=5974 RepID=A0A8J8P275_HALGN|nr:hypothetical protein FGO68_gene12781 [Halteria grandinella]